MTQMRNRIGFHFGSSSNATGWGDHVRALDAAEIPAVLMSVAGEGLGDIIGCWENGSDVEHVVVVRCLSHNDVPLYGLDIETAVADWLDRYVPTIGGDVRNYHRRIITKHGNELDKSNIEWLADFYTALHPALLERMGWDSHRICVFNFSAGEPEYGDWESIIPFLRLAGDNRDKFVIGVHEYSLDSTDIFANYPYFVGRCWSHLMDVCDAHGIRRPLVAMHEFGWRDTEIRQPTTDAVGQVNAAMREYGDKLGRSFLGAGIWTLQEWQSSGINNKVQQLIVPITQLTLNNLYEIGDEPVPDPIKHKAIVVKAPQELTAAEWDKLAEYAYERRHTMTASHDDTLTILNGGNDDSFAKIWQPGRPSQADMIAMLEAAALRWEELIIDLPPAPQFSFTHWPTDTRVVTQKWGNNPTYYGQFGLPGHEGVDIRAASGSPVFSAAGGTVADINQNPDSHNYGIFVRVTHADNWQTTYAHLQRTAVSVGQQVAGGQIIGYADNTGNSFGSHLHLSLKRLGHTYRDQYGAWPYSLHDPTPYLEPFDPVWPGTNPPTPQFDMADYLPQLPVGQWLVMQKSEGGTIDHQIQNRNGITYLVKSAEAGKTNYEELRLTQTAVQRRFDTSPEPGRAYRLDDGSGWSDWMPRYVNVGTVFQRRPRVTWYDTNNGCRLIRDEGIVTTYLRVAAVHEVFTAFPGGKSYRDVLELHWLHTPTGEWVERYFVAPNRWYVCWQNKNSAFHYADDEPQGRPPMPLQVISCLA